jgi:acetoin:2,6-dichlorophenolindophenol oxidoreductase subunit beta
MSTPERTGTIREAINEALHEEFERDERVFILGEDVGQAGGIFKVTEGLFDRFGPSRVRDTPIIEAGIMGLAVGAAMTGMRPIVEIMFADFLTLASDQIVNQAAKMRYMTAGQAKIPLVVQTRMGAGRRAAAQHSQSLHAWFAHIPGLLVALPATPADAKGLLKTAIRDDNPVIFFEDKMLYGQKGPIPDGDYTVPLGKAKVHRTGSDATIITVSSMLYPALEAADLLKEEGIEVEVIDVRTLVPLDRETLVQSALKTGHILVVDEGYQNFGTTAEIAACVHEEAFDYLDAPVHRLGAADVPVPFAPRLEDHTIPGTAQIIRIVQEMLA